MENCRLGPEPVTGSFGLIKKPARWVGLRNCCFRRQVGEEAGSVPGVLGNAAWPRALELNRYGENNVHLGEKIHLRRERHQFKLMDSQK